VLAFAFSAGAADWWGLPPDDTYDVQTIDRYSFDGVNHAQIIWNNGRANATALVIDPNGVPLLYYYADYFATDYDLYYSEDGENWQFVGVYPR
jgi:hypothetical protein